MAAISSGASGRRPSSPSSASACCRCLKQCYESALSARLLASAIKKGEVGSLRLALSRTIDPSLVTPHFVELGKLFQELELKLLRGTGIEVLEYLKKGEVELGSPHRSARNWSGSTPGRCSPKNSSSPSTACTLSLSVLPSRSTISSKSG